LESDRYEEVTTSRLQLASPTMTPQPYPQMLTAVASLLAAGAYLDAKYGVRYDLRRLRQTRAQTKRIGERVRELGNEATLYRLLELADQGAEALWFEGRSLTYGEMKESKTKFMRTDKSQDAS
jgi:hypothetical protein